MLVGANASWVATLPMTDGLSVPDVVGMLGAAMIVATYFLLQSERIAANSLVYSVANGVGAAAILFSLVFDFNLSAFVIEFFWLLISVYGVSRAVRGRADSRRQNAEADAS